MSQVSEEADRFRSKMMPNSTLVHSFVATSDFDAFQKNYDWNGWGVWQPEPHLTEQPFTAEEAAEQQAYIAKRSARYL